MRTFAIVSALAAAALAQDSSSATKAPSSSIDAFPQTSFLQQTDSRGVVTGQPAVATSQPSQPAVATSQPSQPDADTSMPLVETSLPPLVTIPAQPSGINTVVVPLGRNSTTQVIVSANNSTTIIYAAPSTTSGSGSKTTGTGKASGTGKESGSDASGTGATGTDASGTGSPEETQGAAANVKVASGFLGAALLAAFL